MANHLEDMIASNTPRKIQQSSTTCRIMDFLSIHGNLTFTRSNGPNDCYIVLFSTTGSARLAIGKCIWIGKAKSPIVVDDGML